VADGTVVVADGTVVVADGIVVVADGIVVVADGTVDDADGTVDDADGTVVVIGGDTHGSMTEGVKAKPPSNTSGATTIDSRPDDSRTHLATITPNTNKKRPATKTKAEPPVVGRRHTSSADTTTPIKQKLLENITDNCEARKRLLSKNRVRSFKTSEQRGMFNIYVEQ
jgi:hypothetical protein